MKRVIISVIKSVLMVVLTMVGLAALLLICPEPEADKAEVVQDFKIENNLMDCTPSVDGSNSLRWE